MPILERNLNECPSWLELPQEEEQTYWTVSGQWNPAIPLEFLAGGYLGIYNSKIAAELSPKTISNNGHLWTKYDIEAYEISLEEAKKQAHILGCAGVQLLDKDGTVVFLWVLKNSVKDVPKQ